MRSERLARKICTERSQCAWIRALELMIDGYIHDSFYRRKSCQRFSSCQCNCGRVPAPLDCWRLCLLLLHLQESGGRRKRAIYIVWWMKCEMLLEGYVEYVLDRLCHWTWCRERCGCLWSKLRMTCLGNQQMRMSVSHRLGRRCHICGRVRASEHHKL